MHVHILYFFIRTVAHTHLYLKIKYLQDNLTRHTPVTQVIIFYVDTFGIEAMQFKTFDYSTCYSIKIFLSGERLSASKLLTSIFEYH